MNRKVMVLDLCVCIGLVLGACWAAPPEDALTVRTGGMKIATSSKAAWAVQSVVFTRDKEVAAMAGELEKRHRRKAETPPVPVRVYGEGVPERGALTCKTRRCTVAFRAEAAWTILGMRRGEMQYGTTRGLYGTVMVPKGGRWWGTGHKQGGAEIVHSLRLRVDGKEQPVRTGVTVSGEEIALVKESTIWKFGCHAETTLKDDYVVERTRLIAKEDVELGILYYFMHCFPSSTTKWIAGLPDGSAVEGEFASDGDMELNRDARWVAQFEPRMKLGLLCYMPRIVRGAKSMSKMWDKTNYHKYYVQQNRGQTFKKGETLDYTIIVQAVSGETGDWTATKAALEKLRKAYPAEDEK